ncbi:hypothetical protein [Blastomonas sp. AAP53]|uniref:hypothetical protein n=1 Tax=Blastomonas sp. AAP53 TaxID=1248760 RepID=UPI000305967A|nr:hypothetical protein [Blastomonas sp. AAP53]
MTHSPEDRPARRGFRLRWALVLRMFAVLLLVLAGLAISTSPAVTSPAPPNARNIDLARAVVEQVTGEGNTAGTRLALTLSQAELDGLAALGNQVLAPVRVDARLVPPSPPAKGPSARSAQRAPLPEMVARISRPLPLGAWLNLEARVTSQPDGKGLPIVRAKIGRVPVPAALTRFVLRRSWLALQGDVPAPRTLDETIPLVRIGAQRAEAVLIHPGRSAAFAGLSRFGGVDPDPRWVARAYCALAVHADPDLATIVRRAWRMPRPVRLTPVEQNRGLLIAVAMRTIPEYRDRLAGRAQPLVRRCVAPPEPSVTLAGRNDLAKHWAMSAALSVTLGSNIAQSLGAWKELSDSLSGGSGFSFVDIAADRSGERFANAATDPQLARFVQTRLAAVTDPQLLASNALARPEGLDAAMFERVYDTVDSPEYKSAVAAIDALLDDVGVPKP